MKSAVTVLALAALSVCAWAAGSSAVGVDPTATSIRTATRAISDPRVVTIRAQQAQAAAQGDHALVRQLEAQAQEIYLEYQTQPGSEANATVSKPWHGQSLGLVGSDVEIDSGAIWATAADYEMDGTMWVAYSKAADSGVYITRSTDHGATWQGVTQFWTYPRNSRIGHLGLVVGQGDSAFVYVFYVHRNQHGDMMCHRSNKDGSNLLDFPVKADPDSINDFKVCRDYNGSGYWLYCVAGNDDHSLNADDYVLRSTDYAKTFAVTDTFAYASDGSIAAGAGGYLYVAGRVGYSPYMGQLNLLVSPSLGAPGSWHEVQVTPDTFAVMDPVIAPSFKTPAESAVIWTLYSHDYEGSGVYAMNYVYSTDAGATWSASYALSGTVGAFERYGDIKPYTEPGNTRMNASYISEYGFRSVYRRFCEQSTPTAWSDTLRINTNTAGTGQSIRPLLVYSPGAPGTDAGCVFTGAAATNLYWNAPWTNGAVAEPVASRPVRLDLVPTIVRGVLRMEDRGQTTGDRAELLDASGRKVIALRAGANDVSHVASGVYFVRNAAGQPVTRVVIQQ